MFFRTWRALRPHKPAGGAHIRGRRASLFLSQRAVRIDGTTVPAPTNMGDSPVSDASQDFQRTAVAEAFWHRHTLLLSECHPPQSARSKAGGDKDWGLSTEKRQVQVKGVQVWAYRDESSPHPQPDLPLNSRSLRRRPTYRFCGIILSVHTHPFWTLGDIHVVQIILQAVSLIPDTVLGRIRTD